MVLDKNQLPHLTNELIGHIETQDYIKLSLILLVNFQVKSKII
jgi:hypothetical protein